MKIRNRAVFSTISWNVLHKHRNAIDLLSNKKDYRNFLDTPNIFLPFYDQVIEDYKCDG